jgi:mRNA-degrading endonuclease RelE of RelBE toxin-antitoxin system
MLYSPTGEYNKTENCKIAVSNLWKFTDKEIREIKINSVPNNTKDLCRNTKTIIRLRLGDYRGVFTSTSSR